MTTDDAALQGEFHFPLNRAALCAESKCSEVFAIPVRSSSDGVHRCPSCGGAQFILLEAALNASAKARATAERVIQAVKEAIALGEEAP